MKIVSEWMTKDLMIVGTAHYENCDVVITLDERTFSPLANEVGFYCCIAKIENFNESENYIFEYDLGLNTSMHKR